MNNRTPEQAALISRLSLDRMANGKFAVEPGLLAWIDNAFRSGFTKEAVVEQCRRVIRAIHPRRDDDTSVSAETSRFETEMNMGWAKANPELFVASVESFQSRAPITGWQHHIDLSRGGFLKLIAVRRDQPFESVTDYVMADGVYSREIGYDV